MNKSHLQQDAKGLAEKVFLTALGKVFHSNCTATKNDVKQSMINTYVAVTPNLTPKMPPFTADGFRLSVC